MTLNFRPFCLMIGVSIEYMELKDKGKLGEILVKIWPATTVIRIGK